MVKRKAESPPSASSAEVRRRMQATKRRDTAAEMRVRAAIHRLGLRYAVDAVISPGLRRRGDVVFRRCKVALFVDGCFWHSCPVHRTQPKANRIFWQRKLEQNVQRDRDTDLKLRRSGWLTIRAWAHEPPEEVAARVLVEVTKRKQMFL